jgi:hypothetical protein
MGKKNREEREQKRENYAQKIGREKRKYKLVAIGIAAGVAIVLGITGYMFIQMNTSSPDAPPGAGVLGSTHEHAGLKAIIFGDEFDFSAPPFQVKNRYIHFENQNGETVHLHATGVPMSHLFETIGIGLDDNCFVFPNPDKREFCTNEDYSLKFYINHEKVPSILDYVLKDDDRILISYGNENSTEIEKQLAKVDAITLDRLQ